MIKKFVARAADYDSGRIVANPIKNYPEWRPWWEKRAKRLTKDHPRLLFLTCRDKILGQRYGRASFRWRGSEHRFRCWLLDLGGKAKVLVMTAPGKGTCYEVVTSIGGKPQQADVQAVLGLVGSLDGPTSMERRLPRTRP